MLLYAIKSIVALSVMYVPYMLMLRGESFFRLNRIVLLGIMLLSFAIPLIDVHDMSWGGALAESDLPSAGNGDNSAIGILMNEVIVRPSDMAETVSATTNESAVLWTVVGNIYIIGMIITAIVKLTQLCLLHRRIRRGVLWTEKRDGVTIYCHADNVSPYSWMRSIVINEKDYQENGSVILCHEMGHIRRLHSLDIVLLNICQVVQWANPLVWVMANSLRDVHEYEADDAVLHTGVNARQYQNLLIEKAVGSSSYAFANNFNHSLLKKRITMMLQKKSSPWMRTKALYLIPVAAVALSAFATPELVNSINPAEGEPEAINADQVTEVPVTMQGSDDIIYDVVEESPWYKGDKTQAALLELLTNATKYPQIASEYGVGGRVFVQFVVEKDGTLSNYKVLPKKYTSPTVVEVNSPNAGKPGYITKDEYAAAVKDIEEEALRVIKLSSGNWTPGKQKGNAVRVRYTIPVVYRLS